MATDEKVVMILGIISSFILAFVIYWTFRVFRHFGKRAAFWNLASAMQQMGGKVTFNDWHRTLSGGYVRRKPDYVYLDILSHIPYDQHQPPRLYEEGYEYKLQSHSETRRNRERKRRIREMREMIRNERNRRKDLQVEEEDERLFSGGF